MNGFYPHTFRRGQDTGLAVPSAMGIKRNVLQRGGTVYAAKPRFLLVFFPVADKIDFKRVVAPCLGRFLYNVPVGTVRINLKRRDGNLGPLA